MVIGRVRKMPQPNNSVKCLVNTCDYHGSGDFCYANEIEIQSKLVASTSEMTDCGTFLPKDKL